MKRTDSEKREIISEMVLSSNYPKVRVAHHVSLSRRFSMHENSSLCYSCLVERKPFNVIKLCHANFETILPDAVQVRPIREQCSGDEGKLPLSVIEIIGYTKGGSVEDGWYNAWR